jgi:hypothetical protein
VVTRSVQQTPFFPNQIVVGVASGITLGEEYYKTFGEYVISKLKSWIHGPLELLRHAEIGRVSRTSKNKQYSVMGLTIGD